MTDSKPRDVQIIPLATNTKSFRSRSWSRLRFEIEYALCKGTTSNSYLIASEKTALIDPPGEGFTSIYLQALTNVINWKNLNYVIVGHFSPTRIPTLKAIFALAPQITFVCSVLGANNLRAAFADQDIQVLVMRGKETLDLGQGHVLKFLPTPSPRWPEALCTYDQKTQILYTDKLFGVHICGDDVFDDHGAEFKEDQRYYFNCLMAPHATHVEAALEKISDLPVRMYAVAHGPLIRTGVIELTQAYAEWSHAQKNREISVALLYASAYGNTATLAQAIALGLTKGGIAVKSINCEFATPEEIRSTIEQADGLLIGTPTIGGHAPTPIHTALGIVLASSDNNRLKPEEITQASTGEASKSVRERVQKARDIATNRFQSEKILNCNAQMQSRHLQTWCKLDDASKNLLEAAIRKLGLSARASDRILKVSRTIADLAGDENLKPQHVAEAIQYRTIDRMQ
ncbi:MAG: hypothetical protein F6K62_08090 [Sphaerospermopsis sp. SIO1G2]|nr:hypothetical protein [Sphaerospermopsis sp. SIO1G2]